MRESLGYTGVSDDTSPYPPVKQPIGDRGGHGRAFITMYPLTTMGSLECLKMHRWAEFGRNVLRVLLLLLVALSLNYVCIIVCAYCYK